MYNGIKNVSAYKCLPSELTRKVNIHKAYRGAIANSVASKLSAGICGPATIITYCQQRFDWAALMTLITLFALFAPTNKNGRILTHDLRDANREIVARAKNVKKWRIEDMAKSPI